MKKSIISFLILFSIINLSAQIEFTRIIEKKEKNDTINLVFRLKNFSPGEICRIQQKIPSAFKLLNQNNNSDSLYFDKDISTSIWLSLPKDTAITFQIEMLAPQNTLGYVYIGECACFYGGKYQNPIKKHISKEKIWLTDSLLIPKEDSLLYAQIDSLEKIKTNISKQSKGKRAKLKDTINPYSFRIQITATKFKQDIKDLSKEVISPDLLFEEYSDGFYKYTIGTFNNYQHAKDRLKIYQQRKTNGFIVAYKHGVRTGSKEAIPVVKEEIMEQ